MLRIKLKGALSSKFCNVYMKTSQGISQNTSVCTQSATTKILIKKIILPRNKTVSCFQAIYL